MFEIDLWPAILSIIGTENETVLSYFVRPGLGLSRSRPWQRMRRRLPENIDRMHHELF